MSFSRFFSRSFTLAAFACLAVLTLSLLPLHDAFATSTSLGTGAKQVAKQVSHVPKLIAVISYIIGTVFAVRALLAMKAFIENVDENPITKVIGLAATSALLISLPYIIDVTANSFGMHYGEGTNITSSSSSYSATGE